MYSINNLKNVQEIRQYITKAMTEAKCGESEIKYFCRQIASKDFYDIIQTSQEYIDMLNKIEEEKLHANACIKGYVSQI